jgi:hypothetical protein
MAMSIEDVKKAEQLIKERGQIVAAKWDHVAGKPTVRSPLPGLVLGPRADEQLLRAIEEFRKRKLDAIGAQLSELGVDPAQQESSA